MRKVLDATSTLRKFAMPGEAQAQFAYLNVQQNLFCSDWIRGQQRQQLLKPVSISGEQRAITG
jgi:hypothetical protein